MNKTNSIVGYTHQATEFLILFTWVCIIEKSILNSMQLIYSLNMLFEVSEVENLYEICITLQLFGILNPN